MNRHTIDIINREIRNGNRYFYFDKFQHLIASSPRNTITVYNSIEIRIEAPTTLKHVQALLENQL